MFVSQAQVVGMEGTQEHTAENSQQEADPNLISQTSKRTLDEVRGDENDTKKDTDQASCRGKRRKLQAESLQRIFKTFKSVLPEKKGQENQSLGLERTKHQQGDPLNMEDPISSQPQPVRPQTPDDIPTNLELFGEPVETPEAVFPTPIPESNDSDPDSLKDDNTANCDTTESGSFTKNATTTRLNLCHGKLFNVESDTLGTFKIRSGSAGYFSSTGKLVIRDDQGNIIFSNENCFNSTDKIYVYDSNFPFCGTIVTNTANGGLHTFVTTTNFLLGRIPEEHIHVTTSSGDIIFLRSNIFTFISGNGGHIHTTQAAQLRLRGFVDSIHHLGTDVLVIVGNCTGNVYLSGPGSLGISGSLTGSLTHSFSGTVLIEGSVSGDILQGPGHSGGVNVGGSVTGNIDQQGIKGIILIQGNLVGNIIQSNSNFVAVQGTRTGTWTTRVGPETDQQVGFQ